MPIRITANNNLPYKSIIKPFDISDLPDFTVLLGANGSGKTQLLEIVSTPTDGINRGAILTEEGQVEDAAILRISQWHANDAPDGSLTSIQSARQEVVNDISISLGHGALTSTSINYAYTQRKILNQIIADFTSKGYHQGNRPPYDEILEKIPDGFFDYTYDLFNEKVADVIVDKQICSLESGDTSSPNKAVVEFNELCKEFKLDFSINSQIDLRRPYQLTLLKNGRNVRWSELSSGEMVLFRILCWVFNYRMTAKQLGFPKVMLLDEPDAHLNPIMIRQIIDVFEQTLVNAIGVKVIMTTHSPNTVAIVNEVNLRCLDRNDDKLTIKPIEKKEATALLSDGLVFVSKNQKMVFTEDKDDVFFYDQIYRNGIQNGHINNYPSILFIPSSKARSSGSCEEVKKIVATFKGLDVEKSIKGLVDLDQGQHAEIDRIYTGTRYSIENYMYDPFVVGLTIVRIGESHKLSIPEIVDGDYTSIIKNKELRQKIVDKVSELIERHADTVGLVLDTNKVDFEWFVAGYKTPVKLSYSKWVADYRGHDVKGKLVAGSGCPFKGLKDTEVMNTIKFASLLPKDIRSVFEEIIK